MTSSPVLVVRSTKGQMVHFSTDGQTTICGHDVHTVFGEAGTSNPEVFGGRKLGANCRNCERNARNQRLFR